MHKRILFECVNCGYSSNIFNLAIIGLSQGAFTYTVQCPECESRKINIIDMTHMPDLKISIIDDNNIQISRKET